MAYSKQTWDTTSIFNPTRMNHIEDGIYSADTRTANDIPYSENTTVKNKLDEIAKQGVNVTPSSSGKSTLLEYITDVVYSKNLSIYCFRAEGFSDLPRSDWGFDVVVYNIGQITVECVRQLSNYEKYIRSVGSNNQWLDVWKQFTIS